MPRVASGLGNVCSLKADSPRLPDIAHCSGLDKSGAKRDSDSVADDGLAKKVR